MFGKHFASMYERSLYGSGAVVFAVMGYVIATQVPDRRYGSQVTLNPRALADTLGEPLEEVEKAIEFLCQPDPKSTSKEHEGRRLVKLSDFDYQVVNGAKYRAIRNEEDRREQNREAKRRQRDRLKPVNVVLTKQEQAAQKAREDGDEEEARRIEAMG